MCINLLDLVVLDRLGEEVAGYAVRESRDIVLEGGAPALLLLLESTRPPTPSEARWAVGVVARQVPALVIGRAIDTASYARITFERRIAAAGAP